MLHHAHDQLIGTTIDNRYRLTQFLGEGAFAWVYEASEMFADEHVGRVAVKLIRPGDEQHRRGLVREIQALAQLSHSHVLGYRTAGVATEQSLAGLFYIVTELADGSLADLIAGGSRPSADDLRTVACQVAAGLEYIHAQGAVHRDVKPANILRVKGVWKLADFGLARAVGGSVVSASGHKGTLGYMAPEVLDGQIGPASDVYSLGVTLLECLTGRLAHEGETEAQFMRNLLTKPAGIPGEVGEPWRTALSRCLQQAPRDRCSAGDIAALLAHTPAASPTHSPAPPPPIPVQVASPRRPPAVAPGVSPWQREGARVGEEITGPDGGRYVWVPAGEFMMGSEDYDDEGSEDYDDEKPVHRVRLTRGFWLSKCQVTNAQYRRFCEATSREFPSHGNQGDGHPVVCVSWDDAVAYCEHYGLQLPTEAQWEYAARGPEGRVYPWGNKWDRRRCCNEENKGPGEWTHPVGSFAAGASWCGALDMAGNVWEWCGDRYQERYYTVSPEEDPPGPASGEYRVVRGGGWLSNATICRSASRLRSEPAKRLNGDGFRPVVAPR